jgi:Domain of unknown function (DUF1905)
VTLEFGGDVLYWRGPAPYYFVPVPEIESQAIKDIAKLVTYGWGVIPVKVLIGQTEWKTSLFPKQGLYLVPLKDMVRKAEQIGEGHHVTVQLEFSI